MPKCTDGRIDFGRFGRRVVEADFSGGDLSSDGGLLLLRQVDQHLGLSRAAAAAIPDPRDPERIEHRLRDLLAQRLYALCCGYEDLNDHQVLRGDVLLQTAVGRDQALASAPTFSRLENRATRAQAWALHRVLLEQFVASFQQAPKELVLDVDASDVPLHGNQELAQFHAYYDSHCYLPLYVFCGQAMLACLLRPSQIDAARHAPAVIKLLVTELRRRWPKTRFIVRGDSGFCRRRLLQWCERSGVGYVIGLARNARLHAAVELAEASLAEAYAASGTKQRLIGEFAYAAKSWGRERRVITRLEYGTLGTNPRFIVTNLGHDAAYLYDTVYCQRGEAENRIKEAQLDLFGLGVDPFSRTPHPQRSRSPTCPNPDLRTRRSFDSRWSSWLPRGAVPQSWPGSSSAAPRACIRGSRRPRPIGAVLRATVSCRAHPSARSWPGCAERIDSSRWSATSWQRLRPGSPSRARRRPPGLRTREREPGRPQRLAGAHDVPSAGGQRQRLLRLAASSTFATHDRQRGAGRAYPRRTRRV